MNEEIDPIREALHDKEQAEREAEESRLDYVGARAHAPLEYSATVIGASLHVTSAALAYAEAANKAHIATEHYEDLVVEDALSTQDATVLGVAAVASCVV